MTRWTLGLAALLLTAGSAAAQDRPFLFSVTATDTAGPALRFDYDVGAGEPAFQSGTGNQPEQRVGVQASRGRLTVIGRVGLVSAGSSYQSSQSGELLVSLVAPAPRFTLAAGGGVQHEAGGTDVLLARIVGGREAESWRLHVNLLVQKPLSAANRDAVDLITTVGWAWKMTPSIGLGVEAVGEDLEGFWDPLEAEGGARLLVGPSLHIAPRGRKWRLTATGGPAFHPSDTGRSSDALRDLPATARRVGYAVKAGLSYRLF